MQKFNKGDLVQIAKDLGQHMKHFQADVQAIVIGSYKDQYGGTNDKDYTLYIKGSGKTSWYEECQLTLIENNRIDLLNSWESEAHEKELIESDLDWIFNNGKDVIKSPSGASISSLAKCFGLENLWGSHGEGFVYFKNALMTFMMAKPFLDRNDKEGWLNFCESIKRKP